MDGKMLKIKDSGADEFMREDLKTENITPCKLPGFDVGDAQLEIQQINITLKPAQSQQAGTTNNVGCLQADLDILSDDHKQQLLDFNKQPLQAVQRCIHEIIHDSVKENEEKEALCSREENMTYHDLDCYSNDLASYLVSLGVERGDYVPLVFDKSIWNIVSMLGVMKAGAVFTPLDPAAPISRLQALTSSVHAKTVLCSPRHAHALSALAANVLPIDGHVVRQQRPQSEGDLPRVSPSDLAYLIWTSGSTGMPKGTMIEHGSYCSGAKFHAPAMLMSKDSRVLHFASHVFDASLVEILTTLMVGGTVCIPSEEERLNSIELTIRDMGVNWAVLTPSFASLIDPDEVPGLKTLVLAGEAMSEGHIAKWSHIDLVNGYGPSEASVAALVQSKVTPRTSPKNIGCPVGVRAWVVDPDNHHLLLPIGCVGELLIQGPTLARGYLNQPEKSADSFPLDCKFLDRMQDTSQAWRLYKTGDLIKQNTDGTFNFIGRKDSQVKVHGQRVELGEIEHHLSTVESLRHGVVCLPKSGPCQSRLVSVVSMSSTISQHDMTSVLKAIPEQIHESDRIRQYLSSKLPAHMVPSLVLVVENLPFLSSGKVDRKLTTQWVENMDDKFYGANFGATISDNAGETEAAPTELETKLEMIWAHVLNLPVDQIDLNRSFMSLGGDSISAIQVKGQCSKIKISLTVHDILRSKSIIQLAKCAKAVESVLHHDETIEQNFALSPIQQLYFNLPNQGLGHFNQSFFLRLSQQIDKKTLRAAIEMIIQRHSMLRARFTGPNHDGQWQQRITSDVSGSYRLNTYKINQAEQAHSRIAGSQTCLDIVHGPVFAVDLFNVVDGEQLLFMVVHHLVVDLVSWRVILEDLEEILLGSPELITEKPASFQSWSRMQAEHAQRLPINKVLPSNHVPKVDAAYWGMQDQLNTYGLVDCKGFEIDRETTSNLLTNCHAALRTDPVDILLSSLVHSFAVIFTDRGVPTIFNEAHGREPSGMPIDISRTIGWFTVMYPVHVDEAVSKDLIDTVRHVKDLRHKLVDNGRPYFASRYLTDEGRNRYSHHWPFEITFNYLGQYQQLERKGALLRPVDAMAGETRGAGGMTDVGIETPRFGLFEISAVIVQGKLRFSFTFNRHMKHQDMISRWISTCQQTISSMVERLSIMVAETTPSDFPLLSLSYHDLQTIIPERLRGIGVSDIKEIEDIYPCSSMQEGLLISQTKSPEFYAVRVIYELVATNDTPLESNRLSEAWQSVVNRHGALRTVFVQSLNAEEGLYNQVVLEQHLPEMIQMDCSTRDFAVRKLSTQSTHFREGYPPHKFTICRTADKKVICMLEISHVIMDGASMSVLFRDLALAYEDLPQVGQRPLYSDYIAFLQEQPVEESIGYWKTYLTDVEPCIFPALNDGLTATKMLQNVRLNFGHSDYLKLQQFCEAGSLTLSNVFHMAWGLTLRCYTSSNDVAFGYLVSGRDSPVNAIEDVVGPLINMLVCRIRVDPKSTLRSVLDQVQRDYTESLPHSHTSLAEVQHALHLPGTSLFNTALSFRRLPQDQTAGGSVSFKECAKISDPTEYSLSLNVEASERDIAIDLDYWTDQISPGQAANIGSAFLQAVDQIINQADKSVEDISLFGTEHEKQILEWNENPESINECLHGILYNQATSQPNAPAIAAWDANLTYVELESLSSQLAQHLVELGIGPEKFVPVCFDKSAWTIIAQLSILRAGAAVVPLDATHPSAALELRVKDTNAKVVLASPTRAHLFEDMGVFVVRVGAEEMKHLPRTTNKEITNVLPTNACFVIYTSGSTGVPKGVVLEHRAIVTSGYATGRAYGFGPHTRTLQFATYTFDNSLAEIFFTLMHGGCVCVPSEHERFNDLAGAINRLNVNFVDITPTVASFLHPSDVPMLKGLSLGGEPLTKDVIDIWADTVDLHCAYGPSEAAVNATWNGNLKASSEPTNIGKSIGSISWIVNPDNHEYLVPIGMVGELLIEGPILAREYLGDTEKTKKSFIYGPKWAAGGYRRFYKTGDLVRNNSDGTITYLGRKDSQVKLHGQRIELAEIEHHIKKNLPSESQSAVELITFKSKTNKTTKALATFFSQANGSVLTCSEKFLQPMSEATRAIAAILETSVRASLPGYMVPSLYIPVDILPTTSSGKLDRKRLRASCDLLSEDGIFQYRLAIRSQRPPSSEMEIILAKLWESILDLEANTVGIDGNFFRLGGDSVSAIQLISSARSRGIPLTVSSIFKKPILLDLAADPALLASIGDVHTSPAAIEPFSLLPTDLRIESLIGDIASLCKVDIGAIEDIYPCTSIQEGLIAISNKDPGAYVAQNIYQLPSDIDLSRFQHAWEQLVEAEVILRTRVVFHEAIGFIQVVVRELISWLYLTDLQEVVHQDRHLPSHNGSKLSSYSIVNEVGSSPHFIWTAHHALYDGWSIGLMLERVQGLYLGTSPIDKTIGTAYPKFIKYISEVNVYDSEMFWKSKFSDITAVQFPPLPTAAYKVHAARGLSKSTIHVRRRAATEITLPSSIRAAWALTLAIYSGCPEDVVFGEILTGRDVSVVDITKILGPTLATIPTRIRIDTQSTIAQFLRQVQDQSAEANPFQHAGLQHIKDMSADCATACKFQNLLAIHHDGEDIDSSFWNLKGSGTTGTNFYSYPMTVSCQIQDGKIDVEITYDQELISDWLVAKLSKQFDFLLQRLNSSDQQNEEIGQIKLLTPEDESSIRGWNSNQVQVVNDCVHLLIQKTALKQPESKVAVESWDAILTYPELIRLSTQLASLLVSKNFQNTFVHLCFEKSAWSIVSMLAVLISGSAFVTMDPSAPFSRLKDIMADTKANTILCSPKYQDLCDKLAPHVIAVDRQNIEFVSSQDTKLPVVNCTSPAYAIFTSGTTGKPKGTIIQHKAFCSGAASHGPALRIDSSSRVLQFASYSFDASILEIFTTLLSGGVVCVPSEDRRLNAITDVMNDLQVSWTLLTPSVVQTIRPSAVPTLRTLVLGGETMNKVHVSTWADKLQLLNAYGPSEAAVVATVSNQLSLDANPVNMGRAVGSHSWIVDSTNSGRLVPIGAEGELVIDGPILSQGYLNNSQKTAEVFINAPDWAIQSKSPATDYPRRLYRTGDIVKYTSNGEMVYCGRRDTQTKLHGQRLELGDIEHHLRIDPSVQHAMALVPKDGPCKKRLVAVLSLQELVATDLSDARNHGLTLVARETSTFYLSVIRDSLRDKISGSVMPSNWIMLQSLPLLPSGKLDRRRIETWVQNMDSTAYQQITNMAGEEEIVEGTDIENQLRKFLGSALNLPPDRISLNKSFLHLGGDSLSAMQIMATSRAQGLAISVQDIIQSKSISDLALRIERSEPHEIVDESEPMDQYFPLSPIQKLYFECAGNQANHFNQSILLQLKHHIDPETLLAAIRAIVDSHSMLRARFASNAAGIWQQKISSDVSTSFRYQARSAALQDVQSLVQESQNCLDVENGPVIAFDILDIEGREHQIFSIVAHHLVIDFVSWHILIQDLEDLLQGGKAKLQSYMTFQKWSDLQLQHSRRMTAGGASNIPTTFDFQKIPAADMDYWDMEGKSNTYGDTAEDGFELESEISLLLLGVCREAMKTEIVDILLASIFHSFRKAFPQRSATPAIFNEGHGRELWEGSKIDLSRTVGWYTTMCPLYIPPMEGSEDLLSTIRWVKDLRRRIPEKGRPYFAYRMLTEEGQAQFAGHFPMEILFNYLGQIHQLERDNGLLQVVDDIDITASDIGHDTNRFALFEISAAVTNGTIKMSFSYNRHMRRKGQISRWVIECQKCLRDAARRLSQMAPNRTLSEFPLLPLAYNGIAMLQGLLPQLGIHSIDDIEDIYPCSPVQQGMLLAQIKNPDLYGYSSIFEVRSLDGHKINQHLLAEAWQAVVRRHSALRTVFIDSICQKGLKDQVVLRDRIARTSWLECEDSHVIEALEQQSPLDFNNYQPPHRLSLCHTDRGRVFCGLEISHAVCDGTSMPILFRDFSDAYNYCLSRIDSSHQLSKAQTNSFLSTDATRYSEYISYIQSTPVDTNMDYWKTYLAGAQPCHLEALNHGLKADQKLETLIFPLACSLDLETFCTKNGVTMSNVLQLVWAIILRAYVGTDEVVFGYLTSGRDAPIHGLQDTAVGTFINMLSCRIHLDVGTHISDALQTIQTDFVNGMSHQNVSLADIQHELQLSTKSLFNTAFTFQKRTDDRRGSTSPAPIIDFDFINANDVNEYDFTVNIEATGGRVEIHLGYWTSSLSDAQATNMAKTFEQVVSEIISHSDSNRRTIGDINLLNDYGRQQISTWNHALPVTVDRCIHDMIRDHRLGPQQNAPAICAWDGKFSFTQLDDLSTRLAFHLIEIGVKPQTFIPLCFQKSAFNTVAMLAVLKTGAAFVPLDQAHPRGRLQSFIENVDTEFVLCSEDSLEKLSGICKQSIVVDMNFLMSLKHTAESFLYQVVSPDNAAYIIFTSGTTGRPKGTIIEHAGFCTSATEHTRAMNMTSTSRVLQFASHTFDASVMEILSTLIIGGCVCIPSEQDRMNNIPGVIKSMHVTWTLLTPSVASTLSPKNVPSLKTLVTGGEKMMSGHIMKWKGHCCLINAYGPSETSVIASVGCKVDEHGQELNSDPLNIGHAVGGRVWIVDPHDYNKLMCIGGIGELVVEGRTVARGYLNNNQKTSEAFITNPKWLRDIEHQQRLYRTGDLVRYNSDGSLSFVARKDTQIKLNGQRIEIGEIEYNVKVLLPEDCQCAVELVAPLIGPKALAVFFAHPDEDYDAQNEVERVSGVDEILLSVSPLTKRLAKNLDSSLANSLPTYMIPSFYVPVKRIPWTSSGKLDRARLRSIIQNLPMEMTEPYRPFYSENKASLSPKSAMEKKLQDLWEIVLDTASSGVIELEDNFFRRGGDSVAAMKLVGLARANFSMSLSVMDIFRNPRLCDMATVCTTLVEEKQVKIEPFSLLDPKPSIDSTIHEVAQHCDVPREKLLDAYPCSLLQEGLFTLSTKQQGAYFMRNVFKLPRDIDIARFMNVWDNIVQELDILRTRIVHMSSSAFLQAVLQHEPIAWNKVSALEDLDSENFQLSAKSGGNLTQYTIVSKRDTKDRYFVWHIHHALYDGFSLPMILNRVENAYNGAVPRPLCHDYSSFIQYLLSVNQQASNDYWRALLTRANPLQFPQNQYSAVDQTSNNQMLKHTSNISRNTASTGMTVATIIRAAWAMVVASYSGSNDVVYGETMSGRNIPVEGITEIIGPAITTIPTRIHVDHGSTVTQYLHQVQKMATEVIPYQHIGLQRIKRLSSDAELACEFQNLLVIQTEHEEIESNLWDLQTDSVASNFFTYPLVLECRGSHDKVEITAHYDANVLSTWQMQRILYQMDHVLRELSDLPKLGTKTRLAAIEVFAPRDKEMVQAWNSKIPRTVDVCIHDEFHDKVISQPHAQAIDSWDGSFTYQELHEHATRLAHHLSELGVGPEIFVPICVDKSCWAVVGMVGILMAGGAFVPLDINSPDARHREMLRDVRANIVICSTQYEPRFKGLVDKVVPLDKELLVQLGNVTALNGKLRHATPQNSAYVIFTSGTSGRAKGVVVEHRAISTSSIAMRTGLLMSHTSRVFNFASFSFDVSILEVFTTLTCGGCICMPSENMRTKNVSEAIHSFRATWAFLTPSVANLIEPVTVPSLKVLVCGGEPMSIDNVSRWASKVQLINGYGPTEASVIALSNSSVSEQRDPSNIGFALSSGRAWVADSQDHKKLAPVGCIGELLLSGPLLAREYINNPLKTAEAFVEEPAWANAYPTSSTPDGRPGRMYKTGDLVRYNFDGSLSFHGRKDNQVKLNGQRMEVGEIEHLLDEDSDIRHALVSLPKVGPFRKRLVAVVSLTALATTELTKSSCELVLDGPHAAIAQTKVSGTKSRLSTLLPPYMIPSSWLVVKSIPLLASGKLDRSRVETWLRNINDQTYDQILQADEADEDSTPMTETGRILQQIVSRVLNLPIGRIPLNKSFLALGGDSITSMQVMAHCRKENIHYSLTDVLKSKSIHHLSAIATQKVTTQHQAEVPDQDFNISPIQWLYFETQEANHFQGTARFNQSFSLELTRYISPDDLKMAIGKIVQHHSMLRARFRKNSTGKWQQRVTKYVSFDGFEVHNVEQDEIPHLINSSQNSLDIYEGRVFKVNLFNLAGNRQMIFLVAHHLVIDMVSWRIIIQDLEEILNTGSLSSEKPLPFQTWCSMQQAYSQKHAKDPAVSILSFAVPPPEVEYWGLDKTDNTYQSAISRTFTIDRQVTSLALGDSNMSFRTEPIDLFLAAIAHSFRRVFDRELPVLYNETHGRETFDPSIDISRTLGWFTSIFPVHVPVDPEQDDVLNTVRIMKDTRRSIPDNGRANFAHSILTSEGQSIKQSHLSHMEIMFNYLGRLQQLEADDALLQQWNFPDDNDTSKLLSDVGPHAKRLAFFEISAAVIQGQIQFTFLYNSKMKHQRKIEYWVSECQRTLEEIVQKLAKTGLAGPLYTLSDFPILRISYDGLQKMLSKTLPQVGIPKDNIEDIYPCAPTQEGVLISQLKNPLLYHVHAVFEVRPAEDNVPVDAERLTRAWQQVVDRHAGLRTIFADSVTKGNMFNQIVVRNAESGVIRLRCDESEALDKINSTSILHGNYSKLPRLPHQAIICEASEGKLYFKVEVNHAIVDGTSANILLHDLIEAYHGRLPVGPGPLFSDYIVYIKRHGKASIEFWKSYLDGIQVCNFPTQSGTSTSPHQRRLATIKLQFERFSELQNTCQRLNVTMASVMQTAWALCLHQYTKLEEVAFGYLTSGRDVPVKGVQNSIGAFINILVCRVKFSKTATLTEVFHKVQNDYLDSLEHQHCSLAQVQHDIMSGQAIFNTAVSIQSDAPSDGKEKKSISFHSLIAHDPSEYPLTVNIRTMRNEEGVVIRYWTDLIPESRASKLADILSMVMDNFIDNPSQLVEELDSAIHKTSLEPPKGSLIANLPDNASSPILSVSEGQLRKLISESVREVMEQLLTSGILQEYGTRKPMATTNSRAPVEVVEQQTIKAMIDYAQLSSSPHRPGMTRATSANTIASIRQLSQVEQKLLSVWSELLQISKDSIKRNDSFFKLGGDSIVAMQMVGMARDFDLALTVANIFNHPTFAEMAAVIRLVEESQSPAPVAVVKDYFDAHESRSKAIQNAFYERYSLLQVHDADTFLQNNICPKVRSFRGGIIDVFPVTDFQALAVTGTLMESNFMLNYFYLQGDGALGLKALKTAISRVVNAFDILRTVFTPYNNRFFQVVLRKLQPAFSIHETDDLAEFTTALQHKDRQEGPRLGESCLEFTVAQQKGTKRHRIIMRLSHAQYDGICFPAIIGALQAGYQGQNIPSTPAFSTYVRDAGRLMTDEHYLYWKDLLKDSSMTEVIRRQGPNYSRGTEAPTNLKRIVHIPSLAAEGITHATIIKAAWSLVLANYSARSDIVFGNVISGRNAHVAGVDRIIGPCVNLIPVRVGFRKDWTVLDLLHIIQDQQVAAMPYESLGFREIIKHCTPWPNWTNFSTVCQHQNIQRQSQIQLGGNEYTLGAIGSQEDFADLTVLSTPQGDDYVEISVIFTANSGITLDFAEDIFEALCEASAQFPHDLKAPLPTPGELSVMPRRTLDEVSSAKMSPLSLSTGNITREEVLKHTSILTRIWQQILADNTGLSSPITNESSFFDLGGDIIGLAQVASLLEQDGIKLRVEDLVDHPKMIDQLALMEMRRRSEKRSMDAETLVQPQEEVERPKKGLKAMIGKSIKLAKKVGHRRVVDGN